VIVPAADKLSIWPADRSDQIAARILLHAIDALPDSVGDESWSPSEDYCDGYADAMRQVKALLHPDSPEDGGQ
jgi:hypothetical protein